ncbi:anti-sigma regulatory factor (Ser/Thr protein kinase) [Anaerosolibacter carboniphilus]|uniref:Anti-sigma regulatory factor (Ser/Thr protein kinase) n=1 Tax=Anaerosolibacter carboniphilus TaxID=1417629 RepID=A0A841KNA6_9FIRM|nr:anti-sigma regulatory factor [Anaerosolibacter carboniphilus]MBB6214916.1 anti-sigma regulatory factor (Ser/Thr protein kinase) [Anaerosolibacter carboniphilus]
MEDKAPGESLKLEFEVAKEDFARAGEASSNIKKVLRQLGIDAQIIRKVAIATYEAEINIVIHSDGGEITLYIYPEFIKIIAKDKGPGIENIELAMKEGYSTASNKVRELGFGAGMGLPNMKRCSDKFSIESERGKSTIVTMIINMNEGGGNHDDH